MNNIVLDIGRELLPNGPFRRLGRVGRAHQLTERGDGAVLFENQHHRGPGRHEIGQTSEEGPFPVNGVETLRLPFAQGDHFETEDGESRRLEPSENLPGNALAYAVRLDDAQSSLLHELATQRVRARRSPRSRPGSRRPPPPHLPDLSLAR